MIDHAVLLLVMGLSAAGVVVIVLEPAASRPRATMAAVVWYVACLVPLVLLQSGHWLPQSRLALSVDFAGAAALHAGLAVFLRLARPRRRRVAPVLREASRPSSAAAVLGVIAMVTLAWCGWLVAIDGQFTALTASMLVNCILLSAAGSGAALVVAARHRAIAPAALDGAVAGLAAASAAAAALPAAGAAVVGLLAGMLVGVPLRRRRGVGRTVERLLDAAGIGAVTGLLAIGLLDARGGFLFTGQPTLMLGQLVLVVTAVTLALVVGLAARAITAPSLQRAADA